VGVALGALNLVILFPLVFKDNTDYFGLIQLILSYSILFGTFISFGSPQAIIKFYPLMGSRDREKLFFVFSILVFTVGFTLFILSILWSNIPVVFSDSKLFLDYWKFIPIIAIGHALFEMFSSVSFLQNRTVFPTFLKEVIRKLSITTLLLLYWLGLVNLSSFLLIYTVFIFAQVIILVSTISFNYDAEKARSKDKTIKNDKRIIVSYSISISLMSISLVLSNRLDTFIVGKYLSLESVGLYALAYFVSSLINVPLKSLQIVIRPIISENIAIGDYKYIDKVFRKSSVNLAVIGSLMWVFLFFSSDLLFYLLDFEYYDNNLGLLVRILSFGVLLRASMGPTGIFITLSRYHFLNLAFFSLGIGFTYILSIILIPWYELMGVAIAVTLSLVFMDLLRVIFIHIWYHITAISMNTVKAIILAVLIVVICSRLQTDDFDMNRTIFITILASSLYFFVVYFLKISTEYNRLIVRFTNELRRKVHR
jgi:O-antigen/teichoic acid export membrane protein